MSASSGVPPIAYTSDSALVAAIRPQSYGSSTMGVKKSVVTTSARSSRDAVHRGVVGGVETDEQVGVGGCVAPTHEAEHRAQIIGRQLARATRPVGEAREPDRLLPNWRHQTTL